MSCWIEKVAKVMGHNPQTVRYALQEKVFPFGEAFRMPGSKEYTYSPYPVKIKELLGIDINKEDDAEKTES